MQDADTFHRYWLYLLLWFGINTLQAVTTGLLHDETYYWVYAQDLAWGYFDHPPATALLIALTDWIPGALGVRLPAIIVSTGILAFLYGWIKPARPGLFFIFLSSIALFHVGGFIMVPDIPLLGATCLFLYLLQRYLAKESIRIALALGVIAAILLYCKYHGGLLLLLAVLPNLRVLISRWSFWLIPPVALLLFVPHLHWQWQNDFVTFRYHLFERGGRGFKWDFPLSYFYGQLLLYGPLMGLLIMATIRKWRAQTRMDRTLVWIVAGTFGFFLLSSFRGRVEANWTAMAFPPLIYLTYRAIEREEQVMRWLKRLAFPSIIILLAMRLFFAVEITTLSKFSEVHGWKAWAQEIKDAADGSIVVFRNSYQQASKYAFYSGDFSFSLNEPDYKGNQYDLEHELEAAIQHQPVALFTSSIRDSLGLRSGIPFETAIEPFYVQKYAQFKSYNGIAVEVVAPPHKMLPGERITMPLLLINRTGEELVFDPDVRRTMWLRNVDTREERWVDLGAPGFDRVGATQAIRDTVQITAPASSGHYEYRIGLQWKHSGGKNSFLYAFSVVDPETR